VATLPVEVVHDGWTMLTAIGAVAASVLALGIALWSERNRRQDARSDQDRSARTVLTLCGQAAQYGGIEIVNASDEPILDVLLVGGECAPWTWVPAGGYGHSHTTLLRAAGTWNAGGHWSQSADLLGEYDAFGNALPPPNYLTLSLVAVIEWTDSRGTRWKRRGRDEPVRTLRHIAAHSNVAAS
jgi:hypothetical protein